jgi:hypothetical protein
MYECICLYPHRRVSRRLYGCAGARVEAAVIYIQEIDAILDIYIMYIVVEDSC